MTLLLLAVAVAEEGWQKQRLTQSSSFVTNTVDTNTFVTNSTRRVAEAKAKAIIMKLEFENILAARLMRRWE